MWTHRGVSGLYDLSCIGTKTGAVTIIGGARCVWDDLERQPQPRGELMVVNDVGMYLDWPIDHWVSMHAMHLKEWIRLRHQHSMPFAYGFQSHANESHDRVTTAWYIKDPMPYSGMFACQVALALGYDEITLCGIPQDGQGNFFDPPWLKRTHADSNPTIRRAVAANPEFKRCVRSMSGWTRAILGYPGE